MYSLLEHKVAERAVVAKLAAYMSPLFRDHDVDVEYNRQGLDPEDPKVLVLASDCRKRKKQRRVFPDIVVHRRGSRLGHNLLVVEVKKLSNTEPRSCDEAKIQGMWRKYSYRFGVLIDLPDGLGAGGRTAEQRWFEEGRRLPSGISPPPVKPEGR